MYPKTSHNPGITLEGVGETFRITSDEWVKFF